MNEKEDIQIQMADMESCYYACEHVLYDIVKQGVPTFKETVLRFLKMDLRRYVSIALAGLIITCAICMFMPHNCVPIIAIYFAMMGSVVVFECFKNKYHQTQELMTPVYLHPGRLFLFKSAAICICQGCLFLVLCLLLLLLRADFEYDLLLYVLIPLYIYQAMLLLIIHKVHHLFGGFCCYISIYGVYMVLAQFVKLHNLLQFNQLIAICVFLIIAYIFIYILQMKQLRRIGGYGYDTSN